MQFQVEDQAGRYACYRVVNVDELNGIFVIDKPADITSAKVVARVKKLLGVKKAGHTGTLDPFATGVLICCVNQATRLARFFLHGNKTYKATLELGITTDTQDSTGKILSVVRGPWSVVGGSLSVVGGSLSVVRANGQRTTDHGQPTTDNQQPTTDNQQLTTDIHKAFRQFEGTIEQLPPIYSALKHEGVPLYKLARKGKPVQKSARRVVISSLRILEINLPEIRFEVSCSAGTYIRTLAADIGESLGYGAHLKSLRRTESSGFTIRESLTLAETESLILSGGISDRMISMAEALRGMPAHVADNVLTQKIKYGNLIIKKDIVPVRPDAFSDRKSGTGEGKEGFVKIVDTNNNLLAVLSSSKESRKYKYCCVFTTN